MMEMASNDALLGACNRDEPEVYRLCMSLFDRALGEGPNALAR